MKNLVFFLTVLFSSVAATAQYNPSLHTATNKPIGIAQGHPTDARSYYYDSILRTYRPFQSISEALAYLNASKPRTGHYPIIISTGGVRTAYWFKDGTADANLVPMVPAIIDTLPLSARLTDAQRSTSTEITARQGGDAALQTTINNLSNVARTGNFNDLTNKPAPVAPVDTLPLSERLTQAQGSISTERTARQGGDAALQTTINNLSNVARTGNFNDLINKPPTVAPVDTLPLSERLTQAQGSISTEITARQGGDAALQTAINNLSNVARTGNFNDLTNKPAPVAPVDTLPLSTRIDQLVTGKQNLLGFTPVPNTRTVTINGVSQPLSANATFTIAAPPAQFNPIAGDNMSLAGTYPNITFNAVAPASTMMDWTGAGTPPVTRYGISQVAHHYRRRLTGVSNLEGLGLYDTLVANGNNGNLTGLAIAPVFVPGAFTGVTQVSLTVQGQTNLDGLQTKSITAIGQLSVNSNAATNKVILGQYSSPMGTYFSSNGYYANIGAANTTDDVFTGTFGGDVVVKTASPSGYVWVGISNAVGAGPAKMRVAADASTIIQNGGPFASVPSSLFTLNSTTQGFLPPRLTTTQRDAVGSPATGVQIYNTTTKAIEFYNGTGWVQPTPFIYSANGPGYYSTSTFGNAPDVNRIENQGNGNGRLFSVGTQTIQGNTNVSIGTAGGYWLDIPNSGPISIMAKQLKISDSYGGAATVASAAVNIQSSTRGFLGPRLTTAERNAIVTPAEGLEVYNLDSHAKEFYNGTVWKTVLTN